PPPPPPPPRPARGATPPPPPAGGGALTGLNNEADKITASADTVTYDMLPDGSAYYYTDASLIDSFRAGTGTTDTSSKELKSAGATAATHGTAANPFVINTVAQWTKFADDTTNAQNANNVFVLGSDLDFESTQGNFKPVPTLKAKFYGTNHKLKNITHNFGGVTGNYGVFCVVTADSVVADVSLDNVNMTGAVAGKEYHYNGTLIGDNLGASVLNCHVKGSLSGTHSYYNSSTDSKASETGGLMGSFRGGSGYVYRCSVDITMNISISTHGGGGGIIGNINQGATLKMYDCFAIVNWAVTMTVKTYDMYFGGIAGMQHNRDSVCDVTLENCVNYMKITLDRSASTITPNITLHASTITGYGSQATKLTFNNIYTSGDQIYPPNSAYSTNIFGSTWYGTTAEHNTKVVKGSNYNWYAQSVSNIAPSGYQPIHLAVSKGVPNTQYNGTNGTRADLYEDAKNSTFLSSKIWVNKSVIDEAYMTNTDITSTSGYTIENSPVRNPLIVRVSYYNHKTSGDEAIAFSGVTQPVIKKAGDSLERPADTSTRKFIGWTTDANWTQDKMGTDEAPFTSMPANLIGDNKLYAVWQAKTSSVDITAKMGRSGDALAYDATNGFVGTFDGTGIVLTANLTTVSDMTNPQITYQWTRGGENIKTDGTGKDYTVKYVNDTRTEYDNFCEYGVKLNYVSGSEPLFFGSANVSQKKVTMNPVDKDDIEFMNVRIKSGQRAYIGANTSSVDILGEVYFGMTELEGKLAWDNLNARFGADDGNISGNRETRTIYFVPDESYGGNYGATVPYTFTFPIDTLKFTFKLTGFTDPTMQQIQVDLVYGDNYGYSKIADLFEEAMVPHMSKLGGNAPIFKLLDNSEYRIAAFRTENKTFENVSDPAVLQITVRFEPQSHTVTFDENGGTLEEGAELKSQSVRYGNHASVPNVKMTNGSLLFLGWFYNTTDDKGNPVEKQWDFDNDCVTQNLDFHAVWLSANTLEGLTVEPVSGAVFPANE
ncbi:MAG: hypothetical protein K2N74_01215, partial [Clostridiales bacterium]|nr:hypothetical protein [Clostridiales bacterium]